MTALPIIVDTETVGLKIHHVAVEIAFWVIETGERGRFVPPFTEQDLLYAEKAALHVNQFHERGLLLEEKDVDGEQLEHLHGLLVGNTMVGSNPGFDAGKLNLAFDRQERYGLSNYLSPDPWWNLWDLRFYAGDLLGLTGNLPGLGGICRLLDIEPGNHTAESDVTAAGLCFLELQRRDNFRRTA